MNMPITSNWIQLPVPPHYMRAIEQQHVREMSAPMGRPDGDHRSAERIIEHSPVLKRLLENRDNYLLLDELKMQVGDWSAANPDSDARANAAYDLDKVLRFLDNVDDRTLHASHSRNGMIDGLSSDARVLDHSEASLLQAFSRKGYEVLRHLPT